VDEDNLTKEQVKSIVKLFVTKGERIFAVGTTTEAQLNQLAYLMANGYTLSRPS
jgi:hypothetical protein